MILETIKVEVEDHIATITLNRPEKSNAMNWQLWQDIRRAMRWADSTPQVRSVIIRGEGPDFTVGIDLELMSSIYSKVYSKCSGRRAENLRSVIIDLQEVLNSIENCKKPVIAAIDGACVRGGVDLICCADIRYASSEAYFSVKEVDIGMAADISTLQRLPKIIGNQSIVRELTYTGRRFSAQEAQSVGLVGRVFASREDLYDAARDTALVISAKSPLSVRSTKDMLNYGRDHSVADGLRYIATWDAAALFSSDLDVAFTSSIEKTVPVFDN